MPTSRLRYGNHRPPKYRDPRFVGLPKGFDLQHLAVREARAELGLIDPARYITDSTDANGLPPWTAAAMGYVDGNWQSYDPIRARFPNLASAGLVVPITVNGSSKARLIDCEPGDVTPSYGAGWVSEMVQDGVENPGMYGSMAMAGYTITECQQACAARGLDVAHLCFVVAGYPSGVTIDMATWPTAPPAGCDAWQFADFGSFDVSVSNGVWPRITAPTPPPPPPPPPIMEDDDMRCSPPFDWNGQLHFLTIEFGRLVHCFEPEGAPGSWRTENLSDVFKLPSNAVVTSFNYREVKAAKTNAPISLQVTLVADNYGSGFGVQGAGSGTWGFNKAN